MTRIEVRKGQFNIIAPCDYCGVYFPERESHFLRKKRHFCSMVCYSNYRRDCLPVEEQHAYGALLSKEETQKRRNARSVANHAIQQGKIERKPCEMCGKKAEAHHDDYSKPLEIRWLCFRHHRQWHNENPELING